GNGTVVAQVDYVAPSHGDKVTLTIDYELQAILEETLAKNVATNYAEQQIMYQDNKEKYDAELADRSKKEISYCQSGACIVMEVNTGRVLALVSVPTYDVNLFTGGISEEDYKALSEDPTKPLFNNAISSVSTPGSIFKMCTAVAGLMEEEISLSTVIDDEGPYTKHLAEGANISDAPKCHTRYPWKHAGGQTVVEALRDSCNYFFYEVAYRLGNDKLNEWADNFGLTSKTNIELTGESTGRVANQKVLYDNEKPINNQMTYKPQLVYSKLKNVLKGFGEERNVVYTDEQLEAAADRIIYLAGEGNQIIGAEIRQILREELDIPENVSRTRGWAQEVLNWIRELMWTDNDTVVAGIGVEPTQLTPIAVARYMCALVNGGKVYDAHIVAKITDSKGNIVKEFEPTLVRDLDLPSRYTEAIKKGMEQVVSDEDGGTAGEAFKDFKYRDIIFGKTGTAPVSDIELEDNVWLCLAAPREDPEIVVVCFLPNGYSKSNAYPTAKKAIEYYFDAKEAQTSPDTPADDVLAE
ncbi:MAG: hypothetical protein IJP03_05015, partial [Christensenellaceae bacterium]|nr:hypothetical protein [Christensenellaceae bacterium]